MTYTLQVGRLRLRVAEAEEPVRAHATFKAVPPVRPEHRVASRRHARLCATLPHRWWPLGHYGQLCLRCSLYRRDPSAPERGQGAGGRGG